MKKKLEEISTIIMGQSPKSCFYNQKGDGLPFLQGCTTFGRLYPTYDMWTTIYSKSANPNDVLFTVRAPVGDVNYCQQITAIGRGIAAIRATSVFPKYLYYLLEANNKLFASSSTGTIYQSINKDKLTQVELDVHNLDEQRHIVDTIGSIDDLIEKNEEIMQNARLFSEKLFSNEFLRRKETNYRLSDFCSFESGYSYTSEELKESKTGMISIKCLGLDGSFKQNGIKSLFPKKSISQNKKCIIGDVLVAHTDLTKNQEIIGSPCIVTSSATFDSLTYSMDMVKVAPLNCCFNRAMIYQILKSENFHNYALGFCSGTTVVHLSKRALETYDFFGPKAMDDELSLNLERLQNLIIKTEGENIKLKALKNTLLRRYFGSC